MIATFTEFAQSLGGLATFVAILLIPAAWLFHRKVIKPLSFVLGLKQEDSPTGEPIPSIPVQLAEMRKNQEIFKDQVRVINAEMHPNGGNSLRDVVDRNGRDTRELGLKVINIQGTIDMHLEEERREREKIASLALKTAAELAALTSKTATNLAQESHAQG